MFKKTKSSIGRNLTNMKGWKTKRKIIVFESDDWGSIRMPNKETYNKYIKLGYKLDDPYCKYDTLANCTDLEALFEVLVRHVDINKNKAKITFNTVVGNPDFTKIKDSQYLEYFYQSFTETLSQYYPNEDVFSLWEQGISEEIIQPQFHGREHVNVPIWLEQLRLGNDSLIDAFNLGFWGIPNSLYTNSNLNIQASYRSQEALHIEEYKRTIREGLNLFEKTFKFKSITFIANNYVWPLELNKALYDQGIKGLQSMRYQKLPIGDSEIKLYKVHTGKLSENRQVYMVRNCSFEPSQTSNSYDDVGECLKQVKNAFVWKKPAIISLHRLNVIGALCESNRNENLEKLNILLKRILEYWPDVEFMSSDQLTNIILEDKGIN